MRKSIATAKKAQQEYAASIFPAELRYFASPRYTRSNTRAIPWPTPMHMVHSA